MKRLLSILLLLPLFLGAQTRFYLNLNTTAPVSPAFNAGWNVTSGASRYLMSSTKDGSTIASKTSGQVGASAVRKVLIDQWVSPELAAQTVTGTFTGQVRMNLNSTTSTTGQGYLYLRIVNRDGSVASEVGTCTTTNLTTTLTNRTLISLNVGTLSIKNGQRFCIDLGWNMSVGTTTTRTGTASRGSSSGTDLAVNNTTTTANNPWVEFSQTLQLYTAQRGIFAWFGGVPPNSYTYATWDPANTNAGITLSNGNLTATASNAATYATRSTIGVSTGKWYWEYTVSAAISNSTSYGVKTSTEGNTVLVGSSATGYGYTDAGQKKNNGTDASYGTAPANGVVIGVALDMDNGQITFYRNNVSQGVAFTGLSGTFYAAFSSGFGANAVIANFGATALTYSPPAGFNAGLYQ